VSAGVWERLGPLRAEGWEQVRLLAAGRTKPQIAADLVISQATVHTHTVHIYAKCGISTRAGLAMFAMRHGLAARTGPAAARID